MQEMIGKIYTLLIDVVLPHLKLIQTSQNEQKTHSESLIHNLGEFRTENQVHMAELRAELALCRQQLEDLMVTLREDGSDEDGGPSEKRKRIIH
jgi:uncharacterized coiled-coil protein SlyX